MDRLSASLYFADVSQEHPWVTKRGTDMLLSAEENTAELVEPPTEEEMKCAITGNLSNLIVVVCKIVQVLCPFELCSDDPYR